MSNGYEDQYDELLDDDSTSANDDEKQPHSTKKKHKTKYHRRDITDKDIEVLTFLARLRYSTARQMTVFANVKESTMRRRLLGL